MSTHDPGQVRSNPRPARQPETCDRLFAEYLNAGDLEALIALYEPECTLVQRDGSLATGRRDIRRVLERLVGMRPTLDLKVVQVLGTGQDLALVYNDWHLSAARPDGTRFDTSGKAIEVVRRQPDGTWLFAIDDPFARG